MNCPECGNQVSTSAQFCPHCGYVISRLNGKQAVAKQQPICGSFQNESNGLSRDLTYGTNGTGDNQKPLEKTSNSLDSRESLGSGASPMSSWLMNVLIILLIILAVVGFFCLQKWYGQRNNTSINNRVSADTMVEGIIESVGSVSCPRVNDDFTTYDLTFFEVHGPVRTINVNGVVFEFNRDGELILFKGKSPYSTYGGPYVKKSGKIVGEYSGREYYQYTWQNGRIVKREADKGEDSEYAHYTYDAEGRISSLKITGCMASGYFLKSIKYTYFDERGNWTSRAVTYENHYEGVQGETSVHTLSRKITYFD